VAGRSRLEIESENLFEGDRASFENPNPIEGQLRQWAKQCFGG
jgi:hypothetical protein